MLHRDRQASTSERPGGPDPRLARGGPARAGAQASSRSAAVLAPRDRRVHFGRAASALLCALLCASPGAAQEGSPGAAQRGSPGAGATPDAGGAGPYSDKIYPPELLDFVEAEYPAAALDARVEGAVVLRLDVDAEGRVTGAEVTQPAGHGLDEAARAAALRFRFRPARRGTTPLPARILYHYAFHLPAPPAPRPPAGPATASPPPAGPATAKDHGRAHPAAAPPAAEVPLEVTVRGPSAADRRRQSAEAVTVVETARAARESADMGDVLARAHGVGVRRSGGLGSGTRFSLAGLTDDQVRFFLDGVPLPLAGYPFGIASVPVGLVDRVEIYSGVVPVRLGADALGGAVNLVSDEALRGTRLSASYEVGSFDTHRLTVSGRHLHAPTGLFVRASGFFDSSRNDYPVDVEVPDERGRLSPARVHRFHDAYRAAGASAEIGLVDRPWARRLLLRGFLVDHDKQVQNNIVMTVPYGGVTHGQTAAGASLRYEQPLGRGVSLAAALGYSFARTTFLDVATCVYDWFGRCARERARPGETGPRPYDQVYRDHSAFGRVHLTWRIHPAHALRLSIAPTYLTRTGDERRQADPDARDPLTAQRDLLTLVSGLEHELDLLDDRLENILFLKEYVQLLASEDPRPGGVFARRDRDTHRFGLGDGVRLRLTPWLAAKASYEWATRLPGPDEVFGDGAFVVANLELEPETSHNFNVGLTVDARDTRAGSWRAAASGFLRDTDRLIVLLGNDRVQSYQNVFGARSLGVEGGLGWTSPGEHIVLDANATYVDLRNTSADGTFGAFEGDRVPNRPYLFANASARLQLQGVLAPRDEVGLTWTTRYVHEYLRGWESVGLAEYKQRIPAQVVHGVGLAYLVRGQRASLSTTLEVQNLTDERVFDFFGVQRPGRSFFVKTAAEL